MNAKERERLKQKYLEILDQKQLTRLAHQSLLYSSGSNMDGKEWRNSKEETMPKWNEIKEIRMEFWPSGNRWKWNIQFSLDGESWMDLAPLSYSSKDRTHGDDRSKRKAFKAGKKSLARCRARQAQLKNPQAQKTIHT